MCVLAEMLCGWWRVSDMEELHSLVKALHSRGIREKVLQKQIQKHMEYMTQLCANSKDGWSTFPLLSLVIYSDIKVLLFKLLCCGTSLSYVQYNEITFTRP